MNGPEATAGSILNFLNIIGTKAPKKLARAIEQSKDTETVIEAFRASIKRN